MEFIMFILERDHCNVIAKEFFSCTEHECILREEKRKCIE